MRIKINENNYVIAYAITGGIEGDFEYTGEIPSDFFENSQNYKLENGTLVHDPDNAPALSQTVPDSTALLDILLGVADE